jgi:thioredoxin 1
MEIKNKEEFDTEVLKSNVPVLVDFWAPWCGPCQIVSPIVEELKEEYQDKIKVGKLNVDMVPDVAMQYSVMSIPTLIIFKNGEVVDQIVGALPRNIIEERLKQHL